MSLRRPLAVGVTLLLLTGAVVPATAMAQEQSATPTFMIELNADGSATVTTVFTYDLTSDDERQAFEELRNDSATREEAEQRYLNRLADVAATAENETGREMAVSEPGIELFTADDGDTGVVVLSVTWDGLAAVDGETLTVTEPLASGFTPDRRVLLVPPDGYTVSGATPPPDETTATGLVWEPGTDLSGFDLTLAPESAGVTTTDPSADDPSETPSGASAPGFGAGVALIGVLIAALALAETKRR